MVNPDVGGVKPTRFTCANHEGARREASGCCGNDRADRRRR
jgi:hypothetical protein